MLKIIENATDYIGYMGPNITFAITSIYLVYVAKYIYLFIFFGGFCLNMILNSQLKIWIREPRPTNQIHYIDHTFKGAHIYGMPSGHAQMCLYNVAFLWLILSSSMQSFSNMYGILIVSIAVSITTLFQRWKFRRHTTEQLAVGSVVGTIMGYLIYKLANYSYVLSLQ